MRKLFRILLVLIVASFVCSCNKGRNLPRVSLCYDTITSDFLPGYFALQDDEGNNIACEADIRRRGSYSLRFDKPSFSIKLNEPSGGKYNVPLLGMRSDNYWVLDGMASDKSRMRNMVSMRLWKECSRKPWYADKEQDCKNYVSGRFVELFINDQPYGIYCLTERIDRKQLSLRKHLISDGTSGGKLYKGVQWSESTLYQSLPPDLYNIPEEKHRGWEIKYPKQATTVDWQPLDELFIFMTCSDSATFVSQISERLDLPVFIDYFLLCNLISARDNTGKNLCISFYDIDASPRALVTPWDMDHSWGRTFSGTEEPPDHILFTDYGVYPRLFSCCPWFRQMVCERWKTLRQGPFSKEHIDALFSEYFTLFLTTGMAEKEENLWSGRNGIVLDFECEQHYISEWTERRLAFLDSIFADPARP